MSNDEDKIWLDSLAGRSNSNAQGERRATRLRQAIQRYNAILKVNEFDTDVGLKALKRRLVREGFAAPTRLIEGRIQL